MKFDTKTTESQQWGVGLLLAIVIFAGVQMQLHQGTQVASAASKLISECHEALDSCDRVTEQCVANLEDACQNCSWGVTLTRLEQEVLLDYHQRLCSNCSDVFDPITHPDEWDTCVEEGGSLVSVGVWR